MSVLPAEGQKGEGQEVSPGAGREAVTGERSQGAAEGGRGIAEGK